MAKSKSALDYALKILGMRDYSEKTLRDKILSRFPSEECEETIAKLKEYGYIDDGRFAEIFTSSKLQSGHGHFYIKWKLSEKGVDVDEFFIDRVIAEREIDLEPVIRRLIEKYAEKRKKKGDDEWQIKQKTFAYLMQRGYKKEDILKYIGEVEEI